MRATRWSLGAMTLAMLAATVASAAPPDPIEVPLGGTRMRLVDASGPAGRRTYAALRSEGEGVATPDPTIVGATAYIGRVGGGPVTILQLPASGWNIRNSVRRDFKFRSSAGPVFSARLQDGKAVRLSAK